ncbi:hypothetical protein EHS25_004017 [Saitozyma podzolica]|uniref:GH16 domain-containing protein n=1 Tax=Saitozyma podzolica TaxID=1890683 RepID=A0A427YSV4_9TREE|nr:hypothetical protein EHS25_004017 [Saitozyma podzolica]
MPFGGNVRRSFTSREPLLQESRNNGWSNPSTPSSSRPTSPFGPSATALPLLAPISSSSVLHRRPESLVPDVEYVVDDDDLHDLRPGESLDKFQGLKSLTMRSIGDVATLFFLLLALVARIQPRGINGSGQYPAIGNWATMIDADTPQSAYQMKGQDGDTWQLVFSDEFNKDGRTFYAGDDPFFEAVDIHYWATNDFEWYDPSAATTKDGHLQLTITQENIHDLNFKSGMIQSWNKLCFFRNAHIEVSLSLPGVNNVAGFWPGVWTMGNLGRPGYGATTEGTWPYTYSSCDVGILPNQTYTNGTGPEAALTSGAGGTSLSYLPGQRLSSCTCQGEDHPGPSVDVGRGAVEIDMIEAQILIDQQVGQVSQSFQLAPFDDFYHFRNTTTDAPRNDETITTFNTYTGGTLQQAASALTTIDNAVYYDTSGEFRQFSLEWSADLDNHQDGYISWGSQGKESWTLHQSAIGANKNVDIGPRLIAEEPMALIFNLGMSNNFENVDFTHMTFPNYLRIDYIRVWQKSTGSITCDPPERPTKDYINRHENAYTNANYSTWEAAGYKFPKNSLTGC